MSFSNRSSGFLLETSEEADAFKAFAEKLSENEHKGRTQYEKTKVALFVSKIDHCFHDIILRFQANEMSGELACIISNHKALKKQRKPTAFHFTTPFDNTDKASVEAEQLEILKKHSVELVILARYMQILSSDFLNKAGVPVINIHHSFLPAFAGGKPITKPMNEV